MKLFFVIFLFSICIVFSTAGADTTVSDRSTRFVIASEYNDFLNAVALTDAGHLYDEKLGSDPICACIVRSGKPGDYRYEVIASRENFLISYTSLLNEARYRTWISGIAEPMTAQANTNDNFLKSNHSDFCVAASDGALELMLDWNKLMPSESRWNQWEPTIVKSLIVASLCFSGYKMIQKYRAIPHEEITITAESLRPSEHEPRRESLEASRINPSQKELTEEEQFQARQKFHQSQIKLRDYEDLNNNFHQACVAANKKAKELEAVEKKIETLSQQFSEAKEQATQGFYRYGTMYVMTKLGSIALDLVFPGASLIGHAAMELAGPTHEVIGNVASQGAAYASSEAQNYALSKAARPIVAPGEKKLENPSENDDVGWSAYLAGPDLTAIATGVQEMKVTSDKWAPIRKEFQNALNEYEMALKEVDECYAKVVLSEAKQSGEKKSQFSSLTRRQSAQWRSSEVIRDNEQPVPGGYAHKETTIYYRLYAAEDSGDKKAAELRKIGAHLLMKRPLNISPTSSILIQEVHVPPGITLQPLDFVTSADFHDGLRQVRLMRPISRDCFKEGQLPDGL